MARIVTGRRIQLALGLAISVACLILIFAFVDPAELVESVRTAHYGYLALSGLGFAAFLVVRAVRWRFMLKNAASYRQVFHIQNIGYLLTFILPFRLGDVARAVLIGNVPPITLPQGLSTMVVERVLDLLFIVTLLPFTLAQASRLPASVQTGARISGVAALVGIGILVIAANQRPRARRLFGAILDRIPFLETAVWVQRADQLLEGLSSLTRLRDGLLLAALSIVVWIPVIFAYYAGMLAVHLEATPVMAAFVVCVAALSITVPSAPGYWGVIQAGMTFALVEVLSQPAGPSASFAFIYHALNFAVVIVLGLAGIYGIGATLSNVVASTRTIARRQEQDSSTL